MSLDAVFRLIAPVAPRPFSGATIPFAAPASSAPATQVATTQPACTSNQHLGVLLGLMAVAGGLFYFAKSSADARAKENRASSLELEEAAERELERRERSTFDTVGYEAPCPHGHSHHGYGV